MVISKEEFEKLDGQPVKIRTEEELEKLFTVPGVSEVQIGCPSALKSGIIRVTTRAAQYIFEAYGTGTFTMYRKAGKKLRIEDFVIVHPLRAGELLQINLGSQEIVQSIEMLENDLVPA